MSNTCFSKLRMQSPQTYWLNRLPAKELNYQPAMDPGNLDETSDLSRRISSLHEPPDRISGGGCLGVGVNCF